MRLFNKYSSYDLLPGYNGNNSLFSSNNRRRIALYTDRLKPSGSFITGITVASVVFTLLTIFPKAPPSIPFAFEENLPDKPSCLTCSLDPKVALVENHSKPNVEDAAMNKQLTESQCLDIFDGLYYEADRAYEYWMDRGGITKKHLDKASDKAHGRVVIYNNRVSFNINFYIIAFLFLADIYFIFRCMSKNINMVTLILVQWLLLPQYMKHF